MQLLTNPSQNRKFQPRGLRCSLRAVRDRLLAWGVVVTLSAAILLPGMEAKAAERVVLRYGIFRAPISVEDLTDLVETGDVSRSLAAYLRMANREPEELRQVLSQEIPVDGLLLSRALNTLPGEFVLDQIGDIIRTPSDRANREALRSAIVSSALPDDKVTLLEVLQNYPTQELHVNGERLVEIAGKIDRVFGQLPSWPF